MRLRGPSGGKAVAELQSSLVTEDLLGTKDGSNLVFTTPSNFIYVASTGWDISVYLNGQKLREGASRDYTVSESGGIGTGYNTITLVAPAPLVWEELWAKYYVAL